MAPIAAGKWFLVVLLYGRMEAFDMGPPVGAYERCHDVILAAARREEALVPPRLAEMLQEEKVEELGCIDGETVVDITMGKYGKSRLTIESPKQRLPKHTQLQLESRDGVDSIFGVPKIENNPTTEIPLVRYHF
jgi:hypothetical protein